MKTLTYVLTNRGLFSELSAVMYCAQHAAATDQLFAIDDKESVLYFSDGFESYFEPLGVPEGDLTDGCRARLTIDPRDPETELFQSIRKASRSTWIQQRRLFKNLIRPNRQTQREIKSVLAELPASYNCMHVRRGDKSEEVPDMPITSYIDALVGHDSGHLPTAVMSDDYDVAEACVEKLNARGIEGFHLEPEKNKSGYDNVGRLRAEDFYSRSEMVHLLALWQMAVRSQCYIGTFSSNVTRFVVATHEDYRKCHGIDGVWIGD